MQIERLDPADDTTFSRYAEIHRLAEEFSAPYAVAYQPGELRAVLKDTSGSERLVGYLGFDPHENPHGNRQGNPVVAGLITTPVADNLEKAVLSVWVEPSQRRRGYGSAMAETLIRLASDDRRTTLIGVVHFPIGADERNPDRMFAAKHGFRFGDKAVHRVLDLPVPDDRINELIAEASPHHKDYTFVEYVDDTIPESLLPSYLDLVNAVMADAPTGDIDYEAGGVTPEMFHADAIVFREQGRTGYRTIALDSHGAAAAYSELVVPGQDPGKVFQWGTLVAQAHRGNRLGLAVKARTLRTVQGLHPDRTAVHTWNSASNSHMIAVNEAMGFRAVSESAEYMRRLDA